ncbi:MAG: bifunctional precorrin-2 dehydrogenase/sirohydrochlorin ferrochelatase [Bacteroidota bacterium]
MTNNTLYPVFFRLDRLKMLIVGAGEVGEEKLSFILKSSPNANITVVATWAGEGVQSLLQHHSSQVRFIQREFDPADVDQADIVIAATNFADINRQVYDAAKAKNKIVNIADTPALCDFYMGSIVTRGDLKVAISTNGKSPTFAKRFRQAFEQILPVETAELMDHLKIVRDQLQGDFEYKVKELNRITSSLIKSS